MRTNPDNAADTFGTLGPKVQPQPKPAEQWRKTEDPRFLQDKDGKLRTDLPTRGEQQ